MQDWVPLRGMIFNHPASTLQPKQRGKGAAGDQFAAVQPPDIAEERGNIPAESPAFQ